MLSSSLNSLFFYFKCSKEKVQWSTTKEHPLIRCASFEAYNLLSHEILYLCLHWQWGIILLTLEVRWNETQLYMQMHNTCLRIKIKKSKHMSYLLIRWYHLMFYFISNYRITHREKSQNQSSTFCIFEKNTVFIFLLRN